MGLPLQIEQRSFIKYLLLRSANDVKFIEECVKDTEKHVLVKKKIYKWNKHGFPTTNRTEVFHQIFVG